MRLKVYECGHEVGWCSVKDEGLYWDLECDCVPKSNEMMSLFGAGHYLGLPERIKDRCYLRRRITKRSVPGFFPEADVLLLPREQKTVTALGRILTGYMDQIKGRTVLRIPGCNTSPHPCIPLFCFSEYRNGFWLFYPDGQQDQGQ